MEKEQCVKERVRFIFALVIVIALAALFIVYAYLPKITGKTITLDALPLTSTNTLEKGYITINYVISTIPLLSDSSLGEDIYVVLDKNEQNSWEYKSASKEKPKGVFIKGIIVGMSKSNMQIQYGIEHYFLEGEHPARDLKVEIKVSKEGKPIILRLIFSGKELESNSST